MSSLPTIQLIIGRRRSLFFGASLLLCCALAFGLPGLTPNANYTAYFDIDDGFLQVHRALSEDFQQFDGVTVILEFTDESALSDAALEVAVQLELALEELASVVRVSSIVDLLALEPSAPSSDPLLAELFENEFESSTGLVQDREKLLSDPRAKGLFVGRNGNSLLFDVSYELPQGADTAALLDTMQSLRHTVLQQIALANRDVNVRYSGALVLNEAYIRVVRHDLKLFLPCLIALLFLTLSVLLASAKMAASLLGIGVLAVFSGFGFAGWLGLELAAINAFAPVIILSLAIAGGVHVISGLQQATALGCTPSHALEASLQENCLALTLTSATTAAGFLALTASPSPPVRAMGIIVAAGVVSAWVFNFTVLPTLIGGAKQRLRRPLNASGYDRYLRRLSNLDVVRTLAPFTTLLVVAALLVGNNEINDNVFEYFPAGHELRRDTEFVADRFSGVNKLIFALHSDETYGLFDRELLNKARDFTSWLNLQVEVKRVVSLLEVPAVKERLGDLANDTVVNQYRNLARDHTTTGLGIEQLVDSEFSALAVHVYLRDLDAVTLSKFDRRAQDWLKDNLAPYHYRGAGGTSLAFANLGQRNARSMVYSLGIALIAISVICGLILRTWHGVWIGLVCNLSPILVVYGAWALGDGRISIGGAVVIGMILGIIVDDTLFLLTKYRRLRDANHQAPAQNAVRVVGPALVVTSICLAAGLATGLLSDFAPIATMSFLSIAVILTALMVDLIVLPCLLRVCDAP